MPTRRIFRGLAQNLLKTFFNRNNDIGGYWAMGQLYLHAIDHKTTKVRIDLLQQTIAPDGPQFQNMISGFSQYLDQQLQANRIPGSWLKGATILIEFNVERTQNPSLATGDPCELTAEFVDDLGHKFIHRILDRCHPHDPDKESRRFDHDKEQLLSKHHEPAPTDIVRNIKQASCIVREYLDSLEAAETAVIESRKSLTPAEREILSIPPTEEPTPLVIVDSLTIEKNFGWVFFYQSEKYLKTENILDQLAGNAPLIVSRTDGKLHVCGTAYPVEYYIKNFARFGDTHR